MLLLVKGFSFIGCSDAKPEKVTQNPTNVILVMSDDQGWGDVAYNGNAIVKTPRLDQLAAANIRLNRFYAAAPVCSPTRASCLTGKTPCRVGVPWADTGAIPLEETTLAEKLKQHGFATGHFGKWHAGTLSRTVRDGTRGGLPENEKFYSPPWENGFEHCFSTETMVPLYNPTVWGAGQFRLPQPGPDYKMLMDRAVEKGETSDLPGVYPWYCSYWTGEGQKVTKGLEGDDSRIIMDQALNFIKQQAADKKPFFAVIWFHAVHSPIAAGNEHRAIYDSLNLSIEEEHWYGSISAMDAQVGRLEDELKSLGIFDNTLLWFNSDNGPSYIHDFNSAGPYRGKKGTLYEGGIRVPAFVSLPKRFPQAKSISQPISTMDIYPTVLAALQLENNHAIDGENVLPILDGTKEFREAPIFFISPLRGKDWRKNANNWQFAMSGEAFKLLSVDGGASYQLYDLKKDEAETVDVTDAFPEVKQEMQLELEKWVADFDRSALGKQ
ncbi:MAG: N-acetylgalactosamine-6-sulfatase [Saprospiraceae bacterium]|nr:MAG: N-acetylgalactosamine-6-sulfatase [Saprospiraceae bacterium]